MSSNCYSRLVGGRECVTIDRAGGPSSLLVWIELGVR